MWFGKQFYFTSDLIIEYEYINGKKTENVKEYNNEKKLVFEGEYMNGKRWIGKEYNNNGELIF